MKEDKQLIFHPSNKQHLDSPIVKASGSKIYTEDGREYLDFTGGHQVMLLGYGFEPFQQATIEQMNTLDYVAHVGRAKVQENFAEVLAESCSGLINDPLVLFANSASEATEFIIQIVRHTTGRPWIGAYTGAYHGASTGSFSLSFDDPEFKAGTGPLLTGCLSFPYPFHRGNEPRTCSTYKEAVDLILSTQVVSHDFAALFVEPVQGHGGVRVPCSNCLSHLSKLLKENGTVLAVDETVTGLGRTGKMFGLEHFNVCPDIIYVGKPIGGGVPLAAIVLDRDTFSDMKSTTTTCSGNVLGCARGLTLLNHVKNPDFLASVQARGEAAMSRMTEWSRNFNFVSDTRGLGLLLGLEFNMRNRFLVDKIIQKSSTEGLLLSQAGILGNVIKMTPPLNIEEGSLMGGLDILEDILRGFSSLAL